MNSKSNIIFWAIIACLLWSTVYPAIKIGLEYAPPFHFAGLRFMISGLMVLPFTIQPSLYFKMVKDHWKVVFWVTTLQILINYTLFYHGLNLVPGALGAVIVGSQPLITAIVSSMMRNGDKLTKQKIVTIIIGIAGVVLISGGRQAFKLGTVAELLGVIMIFSANLATATSNVIVSAKSKGMNPLVLSSLSLFTGGVIIFLMSLIFEKQPESGLPLKYWSILGWLGFVSAFAFSLWYKLLQKPGVKVSELNLWKFIIPVVGAILSWTILPDEKPELLTVTGIIIITGSLIVFFRRNNNKRTHDKSIN